MTKALVLSGGGSVGIAWEIGVAAGLASRGVDLRAADFIVGTSAGSAVGAQLALGRDLDRLVARYHNAGRPASDTTAGSGAPGDQQIAKLLELVAATMTGEGPAELRRAAVGRFALEADAMPEEAYVAAFRYLKAEPWPARFACPAIDALSGKFVVWDWRSGVELDRAVASSCAVPGLFAPITLNGRRYIDGGFRSATNADLATGHDHVLIVSALSAARSAGAADPRLSPGRQLDDEAAALTASGSVVAVLTVDDAGARAMGVNLMDPSLGRAAVDEGLRQGEAEADRLAEFWSAGDSHRAG
jgi:NTE family protein